MDPARSVTAGSAVDRIAECITEMHRLRDRTYYQIQARSGNALEPPMLTCLARLAAEGPMRSGALAESLCSDPSTVSRHVAMLVERGMVRRDIDPDDRRISVLAATEHGPAIVLSMKERRNTLSATVTQDWTDSDRRAFATLLERYVEGYRNYRLGFIATVGKTDWSAVAEQQNGATA